MLSILIQRHPKAQWNRTTLIGDQQARLRKELRSLCVTADVLGLRIFDQVKVAFENERARTDDCVILVSVEELTSCPERTDERFHALLVEICRCITAFIPGNTVNGEIARFNVVAA